jgi:hypothetical protein
MNEPMMSRRPDRAGVSRCTDELRVLMAGMDDGRQHLALNMAASLALALATDVDCNWYRAGVSGVGSHRWRDEVADRQRAEDPDCAQAALLLVLLSLLDRYPDLVA